jgi:hypothetical protein
MPFFLKKSIEVARQYTGRVLELPPNKRIPANGQEWAETISAMWRRK